LFRKALPAFAILAAVAGWYVWDFFHGGALQTAKTVASSSSQEKSAPLPAVALAGPSDSSAPGKKPDMEFVPASVRQPSEPADVVERNNARGRIRLIGYYRIGDRLGGFVEWRDSGNTRIDVMSFLDLSGLGWMVMTNTQGTIVTLTRGSRHLVATAWPLDTAEGRATQTQNDAAAGKPHAS